MPSDEADDAAEVDANDADDADETNEAVNVWLDRLLRAVTYLP